MEKYISMKWKFFEVLVYTQRGKPDDSVSDSSCIFKFGDTRYLNWYCFIGKEIRNLTQTYDKSPYRLNQWRILKEKPQHKNDTKMFDCTTISDRLRTVTVLSRSAIVV